MTPRLLYLTNDLGKPSHLWMRRAVETLSDAIALVLADRPIAPWADGLPPIRALPQGPPLRRRLLRRAGILGEEVWGRFRADAVLAAVRRVRPSAIVVNFLADALALADAWRATAVPVLVHCHGYDVTWDMRDPHSRLPFHPEDYVAAVQALPAHVRFVANSEATAAKLRAVGVGPGRVRIARFGAAPEEVSPDADRRGALFLGRLVDFKGPDLLIRAFDLACRRGYTGSLTVAGDGWMMPECVRLREASPNRDRVRLLGEVSAERGRELRRAASVFTAHSRTGPVTNQEEAFGVAFLEAMAAGLPVVTGRSGGLPELVRDGVEGVLFEPGDVEAHADALVFLERDAATRSAMGAAARERVEQAFSPAGERRRLLELTASAPSGWGNDG